MILDGLIPSCGACRYPLIRVNFGWYCGTLDCPHNCGQQIVPLFLPLESTRGCTLPSPP